MGKNSPKPDTQKLDNQKPSPQIHDKKPKMARPESEASAVSLYGQGTANFLL